MVNALLAGTIVAIAAGALGWFMVLRRQSFAGHTLAIVSFPGAAAAILLGISATAGYFTAAIAAAVVLAAIPRSLGGRARSSESAVIGTVQAFALACGALFVSLYGGFLNGLTNLLFGSFLGISTGQVLALLVVAVVALAAARGDRAAAVLRHRRPGRGRRPRRAGAAARDRLSCPPGLRGGRGQPDHRCAAGVRAAGDAGRDRPAAHAPARWRAWRSRSCSGW